MTMLAHPVLVVTSPFPLCVMVPGSSNAKMFQYVRGVPSCLGRRVIRDVYPPSSHSFVLLYLYPLPNVGIDHPTVMSLFNSFFFLSRREHYYREFSAVGGQRILKSTACVARWTTCCQPLICFVFSTSLYRSAIDTILSFLFFFLVYFCS